MYFKVFKNFKYTKEYSLLYIIINFYHTQAYYYLLRLALITKPKPLALNLLNQITCNVIN